MSKTSPESTSTHCRRLRRRLDEILAQSPRPAWFAPAATFREAPHGPVAEPERFTEDNDFLAYRLPDSGNGPAHMYILRNRAWRGEY